MRLKLFLLDQFLSELDRLSCSRLLHRYLDLFNNLSSSSSSPLPLPPLLHRNSLSLPPDPLLLLNPLPLLLPLLSLILSLMPLLQLLNTHPLLPSYVLQLISLLLLLPLLPLHGLLLLLLLELLQQTLSHQLRLILEHRLVLLEDLLRLLVIRRTSYREKGVSFLVAGAEVEWRGLEPVLEEEVEGKTVRVEGGQVEDRVAYGVGKGEGRVVGKKEFGALEVLATTHYGEHKGGVTCIFLVKGRR